MKRSRWIPVIGAVLAVTACSSTESAVEDDWTAGDPVTIHVGATNPTSSAYAITVGHKDLAEDAVDGLTFQLTGTQGGPEGVSLLMSNEVQIAVANNAAAYPVFAGDGADTVRSLFPLYSVEMAPIVLSDNTDAENFEDLLGQAIATGPVGSSLELSLNEILEALGHQEGDFSNVLKAAPEDGMASLSANRVAAAWIGTAHPASQLMELRAAHPDMNFVGFTDAQIDAISTAYPYYYPSEISADTYDTSTSVTALGSTVGLIVRADLPDDLVYSIVKSLWEGREALADIHPSQAKLNEELVRRQGESVDYHPGAQRYFEEIGILE